MKTPHRLICLLLLALTTSACVQPAARPMTVDSSAADAPRATLVQILNAANRQPKHRDGFFSNIPCKSFDERAALIRNHQFPGDPKPIPYSMLTFTLRSDSDAIAAQLTLEGSVGMYCTILVYPPSASGDPSPAQMEALSRVAAALHGLGARMASGITVR